MRKFGLRTFVLVVLVVVCVSWGWMLLNIGMTKRTKFEQHIVVLNDEKDTHVIETASKISELTKSINSKNRDDIRVKVLELVQEVSLRENRLPGVIKVAVAELNYQYQMTIGCNLKHEDWLHLHYGVFTATAHCESVMRIGRSGEGGKVVCGGERLERGKCIAYSFGSKNEVVFDDHVGSIFGCEVHSFDCTVPLDSFSERERFHRWCLGPTPEGFTLKGHPAPPLDKIMKDLGHERLDYLKMDIEKSEVTVLQYMADNFPNFFLEKGIIAVMIEFHTSINCEGRDIIRRNVENMHKLGYYMFSLEHNYKHDCCAEFGFVSRDYLLTS